jgi:predicted transcriptional regulator
MGPLEARIMDDLWKAGASRVGEVLDRLNEGARRPLAYTTVMSVLARLAQKGYLKRERDGRAFVYTPVHSRKAFVRARAADAASELLEDFGAAGVAGFVDTLKARPAMLRQLEKLIGQGGSDDEAGP